MTSLAEGNPAMGPLEPGKGLPESSLFQDRSQITVPTDRKQTLKDGNSPRASGNCGRCRVPEDKDRILGPSSQGWPRQQHPRDGLGQLAALTCCPCSLPTCRFCSSSALFPIRIFWTPSGAYWGQRTDRTASEYCLSSPASHHTISWPPHQPQAPEP